MIGGQRQVIEGRRVEHAAARFAKEEQLELVRVGGGREPAERKPNIGNGEKNLGGERGQAQIIVRVAAIDVLEKGVRERAGPVDVEARSGPEAGSLYTVRHDHTEGEIAPKPEI